MTTRDFRLRTLLAEALAREFRAWAEHPEVHVFVIDGERVRVTVEYDMERIWKDEPKAWAVKLPEAMTA